MAAPGAVILPSLESLTSLRDGLTRWLMQDALPLWVQHGVDWQSGGYFETLTFDATRRVLEAGGEVRRGRVVARQIFVFDAAQRLGWRPAARNPVIHGCTYLFTRMHDKDGLFHTAIDAKTGQPRRPFSLYEYAFYLYAMARVHSSLSAHYPLAETASLSLQQLRRNWGRSNGGFEESNPPSLPLQSNPHMHMLEAALAWIEALDESQQGPWVQLGQDIVNLCLEHFIDARTGALREYFDDAWRPLAGAPGRVVEPGHQFEWAWLLLQWARFGRCDAHQRQVCHRTAERLIGLAERWGVDPIRGVAFNELWDDMTPRDERAKLWPQTERIKAWCAMLEQARTAAAAERAGRALSASIRGLMKYFVAEPAGLWEEELHADGRFAAGPCKASSFYHIVSAVQSVDRTLTLLQDPAGAVTDSNFVAAERVRV
jgi:mannose-6-phosphate isomerase